MGYGESKQENPGLSHALRGLSQLLIPSSCSSPVLTSRHAKRGSIRRSPKIAHLPFLSSQADLFLIIWTFGAVARLSRAQSAARSAFGGARGLSMALDI
jgi:hypothetical protein